MRKRKCESKATTAPNINTDKLKVILKEPQQGQRKQTAKQRVEAKKTEKPSPMMRERRKSKAAENRGKELTKTAKIAEKGDEAEDIKG